MEKILRKLIDKRAITLFLILIVALSGVISYYYLPRQENPDVSFPVAMIITPYPGASAEDVQELVLKKIEDEINELDYIDEIQGTAKSGMGITVVQFTGDADNDKAMQDVRNAMKDAEANLPDGTMDSIINTDLVSTSGILISLSGENYSYEQLASFGKQFKKRLSKVKGIDSFEIEGDLNKEVKIDIDTQKLNSLGLSIEDINNLLLMQNVEIPAGQLKNGETTVNVEAAGSYDDIDDIRNTILYVSSETGVALRLKDIATVEFQLEENTQKFKQNGNNAVLLTGYFESGKNVVIIGDDVRSALDEVKMILPPDLIVEEIVYQPEDVAISVNDFMMNLLIGVILVIVVVFFGMGARNAIVVSTAIPLSILITFSAMYGFEIYIHQMSLTALIIALGILVDNAIVISDGIQVNIDSGEDNTSAAVNAVKKAAVPVFTATLTTVAAVSPLMGMPGGAGDFLIAIPIVLIFSVVASYIVAMFVMPVLGEWIFRPTKNKSTEPGFVRKAFSSMLNAGLKHRVSVVVAVVVSFMLVIQVVMPLLPSEFFPYVEKDLIYVEINNETPGDMDSTERLADEVVGVLSTEPEITSYTVAVGDGLPKFYISMMVSTPSSDFAQMVLKYDLDAGEGEPRFDSRLEFVNHLQTKLDSNIVSGETKVNLLQNGPPTDAKIILQVSGEDFDRIKEVTYEIEEGMRTIEGVTNIRDDIKAETLQYSIDIDTEKATMMGITNYDVQRQINMALYGSKPTVLRVDGKEYDVRIQTDIDEPHEISNFLVKSSMTGSKVPIDQYANITYSSKIDEITRFNSEMTVTILADPLPGYDSATLETRIENEILPHLDKTGVQLTFNGEREDIAENFGVIGQLAVMAIAIIYIILVVQFGSFTQPLVILLTIPLSLIGSILGLYIMNQPLSLTAFLGIIALIGLVVKNGILLIEYINEALENGMNVKDACIDAVDKRFNAIILSAMTTIMGLFPLAVGGSSLFAPMAISLMAGLMVSTVLTMVVIPVIFSMIFDLQLKLKGQKKSQRKANNVSKETPQLS